MPVSVRFYRRLMSRNYSNNNPPSVFGRLFHVAASLYFILYSTESGFQGVQLEQKMAKLHIEVDDAL